MGKHEKDQTTESTTAPQPTIALADLAAAFKLAITEVAADRATQNPNDVIHDRIARERGIGNPTDPESLVYCRSPITGATFTARSIASRNPEVGNRVVELLDYQRPDGWDRHKKDGGMVEDVWPLNDGGELDASLDPRRKLGEKFREWLYHSFLKPDSVALIGRPLPTGWAVPADGVATALPPGSIVLTPDQLANLGINPEDLKAALEGAPAKAAE